MEEKGEAMRLKDRVAIITGGAHGIGKHYAVAMGSEGAAVTVADIDQEAAEATAKQLQEQGYKAIGLETDVSNPESTMQMAETTAERFGRIDILVNNAAILGRLKVARVPFYELELEEWNRVLSVNLTGAFLCCQAVFPYMKAQGAGKIINVSTNGFFSGHANYVHYVASKAGIIGMTRSIARELGEFNINVNCIAPGATVAEDPSDKEAFERRVERIRMRSLPKKCIKRVPFPQELIGAVVFLASSDSDFITGQTIVIDGGEVMH